MKHIEEYNKVVNDLYASLNKYFGLKPMELNHFSVNHITELIKAKDTITHCSLLTTDSIDAAEYAEEYTLLVRFKPNRKNEMNPDFYKYSDNDDSDASEVYVGADRFGRPLKTSKPEKKFALEFDEPPALIFVARDDKPCGEVFINGEEIHGITEINIKASTEEFTNYTMSGFTVKPKP
ncbi:hypothetical protein FXB61_005688 [Bacillus cereus]|uniref:hypothetical protein n=1 Tax=Bacillus cereus TaxID=1396 RepID=UPI00122C74C4|nr:hypothetical protein [Bacillus cereus]KAA1803574.1 hypothetical protein FXB61_005688 [Bacillus cereus]